MIQTTLFPDTFKPVFAFSNDDVADMFEQVADLLEAQNEDFYRIRAYRRGAAALRSHTQPIVDTYEAEGIEGLEKLPHIGRKLALSIEELAKTGELALLARLLIDVSPEDLFTTVPGIGQVLARRIYRQLGVRSLDDLEQAAHDGRLSELPGFGRDRVWLVQAALGTMLNKSSQQRLKGGRWQQADQPKKLQPAQTHLSQTHLSQADLSQAEPAQTEPSIDLLLEVDAQYRYLAKAGQLRMVTPRRFNPDGKRWLPVMTLKKDGWACNVLYSNTARSHELNKTHDWVVVHYENERDRGQCTIVTETRGENKGSRVVRGRALAVSA